LVGFGGNENHQNQYEASQRRRLCRHFKKGYCIRGRSCQFLHEPCISYTDEQKVFLGGLPLHVTPEMLKSELQKQGITILNEPRIMPGLTSEVCLGSVEEAEKLISRRFIFVDHNRLDVRPYQNREQLRKRVASVVQRSVFLGGLPYNTTGDMIIADLKRLDIKVVDPPIIKNGFAPRVVLESTDNAKMLVSLKRVIVNGTVVDVRPYVACKKRPQAKESLREMLTSHMKTFGYE